MQTIKNELKNINDELLDFYNKPSMALHFQPTNLKKLKEIIEKLIFLEDVLDRYLITKLQKLEKTTSGEVSFKLASPNWAEGDILHELNLVLLENADDVFTEIIFENQDLK